MLVVAPSVAVIGVRVARDQRLTVEVDEAAMLRVEIEQQVVRDGERRRTVRAGRVTRGAPSTRRR